MTTPRFRPPQQTRSQETLDRILDAAESVLARKSFSEATLAEIMQEAGVTVGAFYRRFPDKDALLHLLDERFFEDLRQRAVEVLAPERWHGASIPEIVGEFSRAAVGLYRQRRGLLRSLFLRARVDPVLQKSARQVNGDYIGRLKHLFIARGAEITHPDPERAVELGYMVFVGALRETILFGEVWPDPSRVVDGSLDRELARLYLSYLGCEPG